MTIAGVTKVVVLLIIGESAVLAALYACALDWRHSIYWAAGATISTMAMLLR